MGWSFDVDVDVKGVGPWVLAIVLAAGACLGASVWAAKMEAEAFNRLTGSNVTTWDAMFVELRVDIPVQ